MRGNQLVKYLGVATRTPVAPEKAWRLFLEMGGKEEPIIIDHVVEKLWTIGHSQVLRKIAQHQVAQEMDTPGRIDLGVAPTSDDVE